jgi:hypothetical protein
LWGAKALIEDANHAPLRFACGSGNDLTTTAMAMAGSCFPHAINNNDRTLRERISSNDE